jgi:hypothetical protein
MRCHCKPWGLSSATARTCIPRERTAGLHCMSVASSQGGMAANNGQGSVAESTWLLVGRTRRLYKPNGCPADVRCQKTTGLFDGEARCKSVDRMTAWFQQMGLPTNGRNPNREGRNMQPLLPESLEHGLLSCASRFSFPTTSVDHSSALVGQQHFHDWLGVCIMQSPFYLQAKGTRETATFRSLRSSDRGHCAAHHRYIQLCLFCKSCKGSATLATMKR